MNQTIDWINTIIKEIVNPEIQLKDTLLKVQVLAFKIKSSKLKEWVDNELNGFIGKEVPKYRKIPSVVFGNLIQDRGFGQMLTRNHMPLPIEYLEPKLRDRLIAIEMNSSVSELEHMIKAGGDFQVNVPHIVHNEITKLLGNNWVVDSAWQKISLNNVEGIISSIKSNLLTFLLELADEIGEQENIDIMEHKKKIDTLFDRTIGNLTGETINISIGSENIQSVNTGKKSNVNVAKGNSVTQAITVEGQHKLEEFIQGLKTQIQALELKVEDQEDILTEVLRIEKQLNRSKPKVSIISEALKVINGILIGVAGNVATQPILDNLSGLMSYFGG